METLPIAAWLNLIAAWAGSVLLPLPVLFGLLLGAIWWTRWLLGRPWPDTARRLGIALGWAITILLILRLRVYPLGAYGPLNFAWLTHLTAGTQWELAGGLVIVGTYLWWRALVIGRTDIEFHDLSLRFKIGLGAVILPLLFAGAAPTSTRAGLFAQLGLFLPLYVFVGLIALSLTRLARLRQPQGATAGNPAMNPTRTWLIALSVASAIILALAFGVEQIFSYQALQGLAHALQPVWSALGTAWGAIATAIAYAVFFILSPLISFLQGKAKYHHQINGGFKNQPHVNQAPSSIPHAWIVAGHWLLIGLGILIALIVLWVTLRRFAVFYTPEGIEEREGLDAGSLFRAQLRGLLVRLGERLRPHPRHQTTDDLAGLPAAIRAMRLLYRDLLRTTAAAGLERQPVETPDEFARRLARQLPAESPASATAPPVNGNAPKPIPPDQGLAMLTHAYTAARYSGPPPDDATVRAAQRWWDKVRGLFHEPKHA
jgi:hypothetical protein